MFYAIKLTKQENGYLVTSPDLPECVYDAKTAEDAEKDASQLLPGVMEFIYRRKRRAIPLPKPVEKGDIPIRVPVKVQAKILLWNYMVENRYRLTDIAKMLDISVAQAQRYVDLSKDGASLRAIEDALDALGKSFELKII